MTMGERIKELRLKHGLTQEELGKIIGVQKSAIRKYEKGDVQNLKRSSIELLSNYFKVKPSYLMCLDDELESNAFPTSDVPVKIPVIGKISAGLPILAVENIDSYEFAPSSYIKEGYEYFYLKVQGDSMNLKFPEGNLVLIQKQDFLENGEIGAILVNGFDATIKKYRLENDFVLLEPMSSNPEHTVQIYNPKNIEIKIIGKAIIHIGKVN